MKVNICRKEGSNRFYISIGRGEDEFQFNLTPEELEILHDKISEQLKKTDEKKAELVWNPRSQRHETGKK